MTENSSNETLPKEKKLIITTLIIAGVLFSLTFLLLTFPPKYVENDLLLGYNEDGYFCKVINEDKFLPLEYCSTQMENSLMEKLNSTDEDKP